MLLILSIVISLATFGSAYKSQNSVWLQLKDDSANLCKGALIDTDMVLMSASCIFDKTRTQLDTKKLKLIDTNSSETAVKQVFVHPKYNKITLDNNIVIMHIDAFEKNESPSTLTTLVDPDGKQSCFVEGLDSEEGTPIKLPTQPKCAKKLICVPSDDGCPGAGSVLKCDNEIAGLGVKCLKENNEMVFLDVSKYNKWIDQVFGDVVHHKKIEADDEKNTSTEIDESSEEETKDEDEMKVVTERCEPAYDECVETWTQEYFSNQLVRNIHCKRGFYPYGCVYTVKHYVAEMEKHHYSPFDAFLTWLLNTQHHFMNVARSFYYPTSSVYIYY